MDAQTQYEKFDEIYMRHYNNACPLNKDKRNRRKNERKNSKPWILPWLDDACARKNNLYYEFVNAPTVENKAKYDKMNKMTRLTGDRLRFCCLSTSAMHLTL